jgi:hypothetical protein
LQEKLDDEVLKTRLVLSDDYEELSIREVKPLNIRCLRISVSVSQEGDTWSRDCRYFDGDQSPFGMISPRVVRCYKAAALV